VGVPAVIAENVLWGRLSVVHVGVVWPIETHAACSIISVHLHFSLISKYGTHFEMEYLLGKAKISQNIHPKRIESVKGK
jgi:hypothetical protein